MARIGEAGRAATLNRSNVLALLESAAVVNQVLIEALLQLIAFGPTYRV